MSVIIKKVARPDLIRAGIATVIALGALVAAYKLGDPSDSDLIEKMTHPSTSDWLALGAAVLFAVAGIVATRRVNAGVSKALEQRFGDARGAPLGLMLSIVGYLLLTLTLFELIGVNLGGLVLGGAITGVVVGIAAQQTLANLFAGIVLIIVRPFVVGDHIVLRSGPLGGEYEGRVTDIGLYYVDVLTAAGPAHLTKAGVLAGAVGPGARAPKDDDVVDEESTAPPSEGGAPRG